MAIALLGGCGHGQSNLAPIPTAALASRTSESEHQSTTFTYGGTRNGVLADACGSLDPNAARCTFSMRLDTPTLPGDAPPDAIRGFHPATLVSAYSLPSLFFGVGQTIAVVIAHDDPVAGLDMERFRAKFGLPACTKANGCYAKLNQFGDPFNYPSPDTDWAFGASTALDIVSGICPNCHLLLVEADDFTEANLATAVQTAIRFGADVVDTTWVDGDFSQNAKYNHPGHIIVASSTEGGYQGGVPFPAGSQYVVAVGATVLSRASNSRGWVDKTWAQTSSGCGTEPKPGWQHDSLCSKRTIVDVSAVGSPNPGVAMYDTYNEPGWMVAYGPGVAASIIAGAYALAGNESQLNYARSLYVFRSRLFDVTQGDNGHCGGTYLCTAKPGYDAPSGNGTPNGVGAF